MFNFRFRLLIVLIFSAFILVSARLFAGVIVIQPDKTKIRLSVNPGKSISGNLKLDNLTKETKNIRIYTNDWRYSKDSGEKLFFPAGASELSASGWISLSPTELSIPPLSSRRINYTVNVPGNAKGGYYSIIFFEETMFNAAERVSSAMNVRIGTLVYIEPKGTIERTIDLRNLKSEVTDQGTKVYFTFVNAGNIDFSPAKGTFFVIDSRGKVYARGVIPETYTFPGESSELEISWNKTLPAGSYDIIFTFDGGEKRAITRELKFNVSSAGKAEVYPSAK